uniref:Uncharacterized protein n=1 Tax=Anguilla anguilla TaxID=7936 RepID=A0A0E9RTF9_ANGAN
MVNWLHTYSFTTTISVSRLEPDRKCAV